MTDTLTRHAPPPPFAAPAWVEEMGRPTGKGLRVCVIDSGWDRGCDDPRVLPGIGLVDPQDDLALARNDDDHDRLGHGTACIHQILRIAPDVEVIPVRVFGRILETSPGTLQAGILYAIEQGVDVVNLSLGTQLEGTLHPLYAACEKARRMGMIIVAAGHNARDWSYPAIFENVIGVSAARFDSPWEYRYLPDEATECEAWGVEQPVTWLKGEETVKHGTSFAAPNITGIICLLLERHPGATLEEIRELLAKYALPSPAAAPKPRKARSSGPRAAKDEAAAQPKRTRESAGAEAAKKSTAAKKPAAASTSATPHTPAAAAKKPSRASKAKPATETPKRATRTTKAAADAEAAKKPAPRKPKTAKAPEEAKSPARRSRAPGPPAAEAQSDPAPARRRTRRPATAGAGGRTPKS
ncbi:MAG: S8 family serine peptidase [Gemmatimonadetes bacterium]|nr:S8 family serine peptidase [Gemmatimonadota bacterium]